MVETMKTRNRSSRRAFGVWLLLGALLGCGQPAPQPPTLGSTSVERFLADDILPSPLPSLELDDADPSALGGRAFEVELGHAVQPAFVASRDVAVERRVEIFPESELRASIGLGPDVEEPVEFRVVARATDGAEAPEILWSQTLDPALEGTVDRWHALSLPLGDRAGRTWTLGLEADTADLAFWGAPTVVRPGLGSAPSTPPVPSTPPGVLLISLDTLRADRFWADGEGARTSPHLSRWASRRAVIFEQAVASAPWTLPSHVSMLSGVDAIRHGINHDVGKAQQVGPPLLAEILGDAGFRTAAVTGGAYLHPKYGFTRGFDHYAYWPDRARSAQEFKVGIDQALEWLGEQRDLPFFFFLHTYAVHDPYRPRQPFYDQLDPPMDAPKGARIALQSPRNTPDNGFRQINRFILRQGKDAKVLDPSVDGPMVAAFYDSGVARMDQQLRRLLRGMDRLGLLDRTLVIITSDHGEALGEAGRIGHVELDDHTLRVPLVMSFPDRRGAGRRVEEQVRSIDIVPTILEFLGLADDPSSGAPALESMDGVSLLPLVDGQVRGKSPVAWSYSAAANRGLSLRLGEGIKYTLDNNAWRPGGGVRESLYDLRRDPGELDDLAAVDPEAAEVLRQRLQAHWRATAEGLRLRVQNPGPGVLEGELEGAMVRPVATKSIDLDCDCLAWQEMGRARFTVPAGESFTVQFEKIFGRRLKIKGEFRAETSDGPRRRFSETLSVDSPGGLSLVDGEWIWEAGGTLDDSAVGFALGWQGAFREHSASPTETDTALREQLEALGYL